MFDRISIRWKLTGILAGSSFIAISVLSFLTYKIGETLLLEVIASDLQSAAFEKEEAIKIWGQRRLQIVDTLSRSAGFRENLKPLLENRAGKPEKEKMRTTTKMKFQDWVGPGKPFDDIFVITAGSGTVVFSTHEGETGTYKEQRRYFLEGLKGPDHFGPYHSVTTGKAAIAFAVPIKDQNNRRVIGVLSARIGVKEIGAIMRRHRRSHKSFDAYLVNTARLIVSQPRELKDAAVLSRALFQPFLGNCLSGNSEVTRARDYRNMDVILAYRWAPSLGVCIITKLDEAEALKGSRRLGTGILLAGLLLLVIAVFISAALSKKITNPILRLSRGIKSVQGGELDVELLKTTNDELGQLTDGFNEMAKSLLAKDAA